MLYLEDRRKSGLEVMGMRCHLSHPKLDKEGVTGMEPIPEGKLGTAASSAG